ncbi:MAG: hypothetical protein JO339_03175 [Alphaproteobacteria bacterium]|nr:hypothetical protein [Alphaproteobacteria bacterium]
MQLDGKGFISRFIGALHIPFDIAGRTVDYDPDEGTRRPEAVDPAKPPHPQKGPEFDDLETHRSPTPPSVPQDPWEIGSIRPIHWPSAPPAPHVGGHPPPPHLPDPPSSSIGGGGGGGDAIGTKQVVVVNIDLQIDVDYKPGGDQMDLRLVQVNALTSNSIVGDHDHVVGPNDPHAWPAHAVPSIESLEKIAAAQVPDPYAHTDGLSPKDIVQTLGELPAAHGSGTALPTLTGGETDDGQHTGPSSQPLWDPTTAIPTMPTDSHANMAVIDAGHNYSYNFGVLANERGAIGTLVVLGDSYKSDAIVQTNVLVDHSAVTGTSECAVVQTGGDAASNVADFIHTANDNPYAMGFFGGLHWHVDIQQGNFFDVNLVNQLNVMTNRDWVQQTATDHYKFIETGANQQGNQVSEYNIDTTHYDLVVVNGNYYSANWIFQSNVLLNSDYVSINAGAGGAGQETVSTGANWLTNSATILDLTGDSHAMTPEMQGIAAALQNGQGSLDLGAGFAVPGNGSLDLNVLFINGNYYDLNVLHQTNVMSDPDTVVQTLSHGESGYVATGGNVLSNTAVLANVGPMGGQYVAGQQYSEAILVQTNIVMQSASVTPSQPGIVTNDPGKLPPEAAAIIQHGSTTPPAADHQDTASATTDHCSHSTPDPLSSVLS